MNQILEELINDLNDTLNNIIILQCECECDGDNALNLQGNSADYIKMLKYRIDELNQTINKTRYQLLSKKATSTALISREREFISQWDEHYELIEKLKPILLILSASKTTQKNDTYQTYQHDSSSSSYQL